MVPRKVDRSCPTQKYSAVDCQQQDKNLSNRFVKSWHQNTRYFHNERWRTLRSCTIHLPAIAISVTLLVLNFSITFYETLDTPNQNIRLNALQFAAKIHEALMAASLSIVAINYIQYELLYGRGLSLGGALAAFQTTNLSSLWTPGLWSKCFTQGFRIRSILFILLVILLGGLTAIIGPSSAILMLPSIGWWNVPYDIDLQGFLDTNTSAQHFSQNQIQLFAAANESLLWPAHITLANSPPSDCNFTSSLIPEHCPAGGLSTFLKSSLASNVQVPFLNIIIPIVDNGTSESYNRLITGMATDSAYPIYDWSTYWWWPFYTTAISVDRFLMKGKALTPIPELWRGEQVKYKLHLFNISQPLAPRSISFCKEYTLTVGNGSYLTKTSLAETLSFPTMAGPEFKIDASSIFDLRNQTASMAGHWVEPPYLANNTPSIAAAFINTSISESSQSDIDIITCSIYADWQRVDTYIMPNDDAYIHTSISDNIAGFKDEVLGRPLVTEPESHVQIDVDWAKLALPPDYTIIPFAQQMSRQLPVDFTTTGASLAVLVADAMARIEMEVKVLLGVPDPTLEGLAESLDYLDIEVVNISEVDLGNVTAFNITRLYYGYSYSMEGITRRLAAGVLLTHILITLIHTVVVVYYGWKSPAINSLLDMFVIALKSEAPLDNILNANGEGIARSKEYNRTIKIQELSNSHLSFIFNDHKRPNTLTEEIVDSRSQESLEFQNMATVRDMLP